MIDIKPFKSLQFPVFGLCGDKSAELYRNETNLTTTIGKANSQGDPITGLIGMRILDNTGNVFEIFDARKGRDLGPLYSGINIGQLIFRTRRIEANLSLAFVGMFSLEEARRFIGEGFSSLRRSASSAGIDFDIFQSSLSCSNSVAEMLKAVGEISVMG